MAENNYKNGKIYKITDLAYTKCYYGSTVEALSRRFAKHRHRYRIYTEGHNMKMFSSHKLFDEFGIANCKIELVELYPCDSREELARREGHYIKSNPCVNKAIAGQTQKEWREANSEELKQKKNSKHMCPSCGGSYTNSNQRAHERTTMHKAAVHNI